jgi:hypothetical protein
VKASQIRQSWPCPLSQKHLVSARVRGALSGLRTFSVFITLSVLIGASAHCAWAGPTRVGNGDDGSDLEGAEPLNDSKVIEARDAAIAKLKALNVPAVPGLGMLIPELEKSALLMSKLDAEARLAADQGTYHSDMQGRVYARTFAEPHAATRFFPAALSLGQEQLQALHVHEALHRALPASVRENESVVAELTLAIVSPGASYDRVNQASERVIPASDRITMVAASAVPAAPAGAVQMEAEEPIPETARVLNPSTFGYSYRSFLQGSDPSSLVTANSMHSVRSYFFPFGSKRSSFGLGIEGSFISRPQGTEMGPLGLSARLALWSARGFDIGMWGALSLNVLSAEELKNSIIGRDIMTVGISMRKDLKFAYFENRIGYTIKSEAPERIGNIDGVHQFGGIVNVSAHVGANLFGLQAGGFAEVHLGDDYRYVAGAFDEPGIGRYRILSFGPEVTWMSQNFSVGVHGRFLLDSTKDASFDTMGNLLGTGVAQGSVGGTVSFFF